MTVGCLLLAGCGTAGPPPSTPSVPVISSAQPTVEQTPTSDPGGLATWVGQYSFAEVVADVGNPPGSVVSYGISIYQMGTGLFAAISVSVFGTVQNIMASVTGGVDSITVSFNSFVGTVPANAPKYKTGDVLLTLTRDGGKITTQWGSMKPKVSANKTPGGYFSQGTPSTSASAPSSSSTK